MRRLPVVLAVFALAFAVMPVATAHRGMLHAEFGGVGMPNYDPIAVEERCPDGFGWIYNTEGAGTLETPGFTGNFEAIGQHCSRWLGEEPTDPDRWYLGRVRSGLMMLDTDEGDLAVRYSGFFRFKGDVSIVPPEFVSKIVLFYRIDGELSTEVFDGARGFGLITGIDKFDAEGPGFTNQMRGRIRLAR